MSCLVVEQALNRVMFGDYEAFEGECDKEGSEEDWGPQTADAVTPRHTNSV
jgi:hypothetical protein